jgi:hypothetical protein
MIDSPVRLQLYSKLQDPGGGSFLQDATRQLQGSWKRSIRDVGGFWLGTAVWDGPIAEMLDVFQNGLLWEIRETAGGNLTWQGFLAEMTLTLHGQTYHRDWTQLANRVKTIYSKIGANLITNNSCESAVWDAFGTPTVRERSSAWASDGDYSAHIVADAPYDGVEIGVVSVTPGEPYQARITVNIISGTWRAEIYSSDIIDYTEQATAGSAVLYLAIPEDNQVATVGMRLYCTSAGGEIYADAAVLQLSPSRAETSWGGNGASQYEYGLIEYINLMAGMTDEAALALTRSTLRERAWAKVLPPDRVEPPDERTKDKLELTFCGYAFTLRNKHIRQTGSDVSASALISALIGEAQYVSAGSIQSNTLSFHIEDREAYRAWDLIRDVTEAGDISGNRWTCGVYQGRLFDYRQASNELVARVRNGVLLDPAGGPLQGWYATPGMVALNDMPVAWDASGSIQDRSDRAWMSEVEFDLGEYLESGGKGGVSYRRMAL